MGLEVGDGFISGLVATNPVGATDPKSQGDDHIRLIKTALLGTFPNLSAAVTLTAAQINDAARQSAANVFTTQQKISNSSGKQILLDDTNAGAGLRQFYLESDGGHFAIASADDAGSGVQAAVDITKDASGAITAMALTATAITLNGVSYADFARKSTANAFDSGATGQTATFNSSAVSGSYITFMASGTPRVDIGIGAAVVVGATTADLGLGARSGDIYFTRDSGSTTAAKIGSSLANSSINGVAFSDFARLSQSNTFTGATQNITASGADATINLTRSGAVTLSLSGSSSYGILGTGSNHPLAVLTNGTTRMEISATGNYDFKSGTVTTSNASASEVGPVGTPRRSISSSGNTAASDAGRSVHFDGGSGQTFTLDSDPPADSIVVLVNRSGANWTIAASGTLTQGGTTGSRTMATGSFASAYHIGSGSWYISGNGLT